MKKYLGKGKDLISSFQSFKIQQVARAENAGIDTLLKLVASLPSDLRKDTYLEVLKKLSLEEPQLVQQIDEELSWIDPLFKYL